MRCLHHGGPAAARRVGRGAQARRDLMRAAGRPGRHLPGRAHLRFVESIRHTAYTVSHYKLPYHDASCWWTRPPSFRTSPLRFESPPFIQEMKTSPPNPANQNIFEYKYNVLKDKFNVSGAQSQGSTAAWPFCLMGTLHALLKVKININCCY